MHHGELVTLALLAKGPMHAYELNKEIDSMQARQWVKLGASTLYRVLHRLLKKGHVTVESARVGQRPTRNIYALTGNGRAALKDHVISGLRSRTPVYSDRVVAAVFAETAGPQAANEIAATLTRLEQSLETLSKACGDRQLSSVGRTIIEFQKATMTAERAIIKELSEITAAGIESG